MTKETDNTDTKKPLRVAVVQFRRSRRDPDDNRRRMDALLPEISGVDIVLLPEAWRGPALVEMTELDSMLELWSGIARQQKYTIITGGLYVNTKKSVVDLCHVISAEGEILGVTEKVFPSIPVGERAFLAPGANVPVYEAAGAKFGILICVDMMYPELARSLVRRGAQIIFNPANIPSNRLSFWHSLQVIRAAENTVFTVFANNTGTHYPDNRDVLGGSFASMPYGVLNFQAGEEPGIHVLELNLDEIPRIRPRWPYLEDVISVADFSGETVTRGEE